MKISLAAVTRPVISASVRLTFLPGLEPLTWRSFSRILSTSTELDFVAMVGEAKWLIIIGEKIN